MVDALLDDLADLPGLQITAARHSSVPPFRRGIADFAVDSVDGPLAGFEAALAGADAVWPIAPETSGWLGRFVRHARAARRRVIAASDDAITIASSKHATSRRLAAAGVPVAPVWRPDEAPSPPTEGEWVLKPDDGAGADRTWRLRPGDAIARVGAAGDDPVLSPWVTGEPMSLSALGDGGRVELLSVNRQRIEVAPGGVVSLVRVETAVQVSARTRAALATLANDVARAMPGLVGYFGIDLIARSDDEFVVVEVNPRLTLAYVGLSAAIGRNVARSVLIACGGFDAFR